MERLYNIWGYIVAMETTGVWLLGRYLIGPFRVMIALLFSISRETSGGPKVAIELKKNKKKNKFLVHFRFYKLKFYFKHTKKLKLGQRAVYFLTINQTAKAIMTAWSKCLLLIYWLKNNLCFNRNWITIKVNI